MYLPFLKKELHIAVIGGGLAGLCTSLDLSKRGFQVTLIEKDTYPRHRVCGEYVSYEIVPYLEYLGISISQLTDIRISDFHLSTQKGNQIKSRLPLGGFGVSRYTLDNHLYQKGLSEGISFLQEQVVAIKDTTNNAKKEIFFQKRKSLCFDIVVGAYGKRSVIDKSLNRNFINGYSPWLGVKAHYTGSFDDQRVALHNFEGGYCGISKVEDDKINVCYLVHFDSFKKYRHLKDFEISVLHQNKYLKQFFENSEMVFDKPITISQVNFSKKPSVEKGILMVGDAAGLIHPLCGNGMAMAIKGASLIATTIDEYAAQHISKEELYKLYKAKWENNFSRRLKAGRILQNVLLNSNVQELSYKMAKCIPAIVPKIIKQTHGKPMICT